MVAPGLLFVVAIGCFGLWFRIPSWRFRAGHLAFLGSAGIAFGASQCILVRNEESRARLPAGLKNSLVLTVEQSKGLEFDEAQQPALDIGN